MIQKVTRLIVNADDLGLASSVNRGIIEAIEGGIVTSASLMVNMPACDDAIRRLTLALGRGAAPPPGIGLHFNIVAGRPLEQCRTLSSQRTGEFLPMLTLAWRAWAGRLDAREIERELEAQLHRAKRLLIPIGLQVTHIDSHRHAHCLPGVFDIVVRAARRHGIAHVRHSCEAPGMQLWRPHAMLASRLLRAVVAKREPPPLDDVRFTGIAMMGSRTFDSDIARIIASLPAGTTELMVHPGYDSPELAAIDAYRAPRERELRALTSPALRDRIEAMGIELTHFDASSGRSTVPAEPRATRDTPAPS